MSLPCPGIATVIALALVLAVATVASCAVEVREDGYLYVDDEPFFAIGLYSAGGPLDMPVIAEAGFNVIHSYAWEGQATWEEGEAWLDAAHENGLKALVGLYRPHVREMKLESAITRIEKFRGHPAVLAWHLMDEPGWEKEGDMGKEYMPAFYELVKQHDPDHPATAVVCHFSDTATFEPFVDIMQADYYCIPPLPANWYAGKGFRGVKMFVDKWNAACEGRKPFWYVGQIFDYSFQKEAYNPSPWWQRLPNRAEIRCMTYTAVASGARGVMYWSLSRLMQDEWNRSLLGRAVLWENLKEVVGELNVLMPLLTATTEETVAARDYVVSMVKSDGRDTYVIAANYERGATTTTIEVPGLKTGIAEVVFGEPRAKNAPIRNGQFTLDLHGLETRVYRVRTTRQ
jgi:hypothetical protein